MLDKFGDYKIKELSGGMKRRVSVAISLVSDPKIIYLDEPSTGLDPENRRQLWDILAKLKGKKAMLLTTHSMEEADVLCNRIAIFNNGILRCISPQVRLKSLYGGGYHLSINVHKQRFFKLKRMIQKRAERKNKTDELNLI
jgi:ABC-type multidrug transport system ATPase subunit